MENLYIAGSLASLVALGLTVGLVLYPQHSRRITVWAVGVFVVSTAAFWVLFLVVPNNPVRKFIWERSIAMRTYADPATGFGVAEGDINIGWTDDTTVLLPPFAEVPVITLTRGGSGDAPEVTEVTEDAFTIQPNSSDQAGRWHFRARGRLLKAD